MKLIIAEKPSVAQTIAKVTGSFLHHDGYNEGGGYLVSWCYGHLVTLDTDSMTGKKWDLDSIPLIPQKWLYKDTGEHSKGQLRILKSLEERKNVESVVCATDAGREGELIFRLVYSYLKFTKPILRLWTSSLEESAIKEGLDNLRNGNEFELLSKAAYARQEADWIVGINATRLYTGLNREKGLLNVGRVQTPTLNMIVQRGEEIRSFKVSSSYVVKAVIDTFSMESENFEKEEDAQTLLSKCKGKNISIKNIERNEKKVAPPLLYSLNTLQMDANKTFGFSAQKTLDLMQNLYEKKLVTYPRTDSQYITEDMIGSFFSLGKEIAKTLSPEREPVNPNRLADNSKVSDHSAILVTKTWLAKRNDESVTPDGKKIIDLIERRILSSLSPWYVYEEEKITGECENTTFKGTGRKEKEEGFKWVERELPLSTKKSDKKEEIIPNTINRGSIVTPSLWSKEKRDTKPKSYYTEATLLAAMDKAGSEDAPEDAERKGLGTSATRAAIIENLISNEFVQRVKGKGKEHLEATEKGEFLISIVDPVLKDPKTTADWEWKLKGIEKGKEELDTFIGGIGDEISSLITKSKAEHPALPKKEKEVIAACPLCKSNILENKAAYYCENKECNFIIWKTAKLYRNDMITKNKVKMFLDGEEVSMKIYSEKNGKDFDANMKLKKGKQKDGNYLELIFNK